VVTVCGLWCAVFAAPRTLVWEWELPEALRNYLNQRYELRRILARPVIAGLQLLRRVLEEAARWAQGAQEQEQLWEHWVEEGS
jgi:hypothetical protein